MFSRIKKIFGKEKKPKSEDKTKSFVTYVKTKISLFRNLILDFVTDTIEELSNIRKKSKNILQTNMNLGKFHIEKGNISDAIFRFKFILRFWPKEYDAYYYLAYCYYLKRKDKKAKETLQKLLNHVPDHMMAHKLMNKIDEQNS